MKEIKDDKRRWKVYYALGLEESNCQNDYTTQGNLQIPYNPYQATKNILH